MITPTPRIGLIVPASNTAAEVQFQRYAPVGVGVHTTRLRMTGNGRGTPQTGPQSRRSSPSGLGSIPVYTLQPWRPGP